MELLVVLVHVSGCYKFWLLLEELALSVWGLLGSTALKDRGRVDLQIMGQEPAELFAKAVLRSMQAHRKHCQSQNQVMEDHSGETTETILSTIPILWTKELMLRKVTWRTCPRLEREAWPKPGHLTLTTDTVHLPNQTKLSLAGDTLHLPNLYQSSEGQWCFSKASHLVQSLKSPQWGWPPWSN